MLSMINHLPGHFPVNANIFSSNETCLFGTQEHQRQGIIYYHVYPTILSNGFPGK